MAGYDTDDLPVGAIAIIGMSGRFPGAKTVRQHWNNVLVGRDCISRFDDAELEDTFDVKTRRDPAFVKARPILEDVDRFDAGFFSILPREAALTDPQQRIFLEIAWEALEDAGYDPAQVAGPVGVFAGTSMNTYFLKHVLTDRSVIDEFTSQFQIGEYQKLVGAGDFVATRTAYKLGLRGPAVSVQTACSTSLTAVGQAVQSLQLFQSDMALAGGASITFPQKRGYLYEEGGMGAPDGRCRPFDAAARGTIFGSGAGVVLLKRLEDAVADNDPIYAVIRGFGIDNDGADKVGFTAPSVDGQAAAIASAYANADIDPATVGYIEAHGTATPLGDPIEFTGLIKAFRMSGVDTDQFCALGSVKANVGHLDAAAGVTGLISAALALSDKVLPPLLHFKTANPNIDLSHSPFFINTRPKAWEAGATPRRAGVSSLGVGGTNVHVVLEEAPVRRSTTTSDGLHILPLSARSDAALARMKMNLADYLDVHPDIKLADVAVTLQSGRRNFAHRAFVVSVQSDEAASKLRKGAIEGIAPDATTPVVFMFPGQGAQYPGMGKALYASEPIYRHWIDKGAAVLLPHIGLDIRDLLLNEAHEGGDATHQLHWTVYAQPALFLVEYALAQVWMARGVRPSAMIGHSIGELVAATLAETMTFESALTLIAARGALMQSTEPGAMLAVRLPESELRSLLPPDIDIAALNAPSLSVVAGPFDAIAAFETHLENLGVHHRRLHTSHAFHSRMMDAVVTDLAKVADNIDFFPPKIPYVSSLTGAWAAIDQPVTGAYWAKHCRETVRFSDAAATVTAEARPLLLEIGPGRNLTNFALQGLSKNLYKAAIPSMPEFSRRHEELAVFAEATGCLWLNGTALDWKALKDRNGQRISLPTYAFEPERHWIEAPHPNIGVSESPASPQTSNSHVPAAGTDEQSPMTKSVETSPQINDRKARLISEVVALLTELSGEKPDISDPNVTFWDLGYDSLFMGQMAQQLRRRYDVKITFRQIMGEYPTIRALVDFLVGQMPPEEALPAAVSVAPATPAAAPASAPRAGAATSTASAPAAATAFSAPADGTLQAVMRDQLAAMQALMERQLQMLGGVAAGAPASAETIPAPASLPPITAASSAAPAATVTSGPSSTTQIKFDQSRPSRFSAYKPGVSGSVQLTQRQKAFVEDLAVRYSAKTPLCKERTQANRKVLADPRTASGFREEWKEFVYPIVAQRSKGSMIWDIDGNEYVDVVNGYGQTAFGHTPDFVVEAVNAQMAEGFAIGPQTPLAGEVAQLFAEMTGHERVTFCNTGSEAVMAAMRLARTITGKEKIVCFDGDYHGQFDEVLVKPGSKGGVPRAFPIAPGIPPASVGNMVVLPYAKPESFEWIKANIDEIAAVLVEPVQSRHPNLQPKAFIEDLRALTAANDTALIVDEVVTGFRVHPAGMQGYWGIRGDLATYGKVVGGGLPVGVLAGSSKFMDALDGGQWQFGDASVPEVAPTFFAGTFVRHPLVLAAMKAVLAHLKSAGPELQKALAGRTAALVERLNGHLEKAGLVTRVETFSSWFYVNPSAEDRLGGLLFPYMRLMGVHIMESFPCFLTTAHSDSDIAKIETAFVESLAALQAAGILSSGTEADFATAEPAAAPSECAPTEPQKEIWMSAQLGDAASLTFNESFTLLLAGELDEAAFERAFAGVVARHDALSVHFSRVGDRMYSDPGLKIPLEKIDFSASSDAAAALEALKAAEAREAFDLTTPPLARAKLVRISPTTWAFVFTAHHIICDGWSINIVLRDLQALCAAEQSGQPPQLEEVQSFLAFAKAEDLAGIDAETRRFWLDLYRNPVPQLDLPGDRPRPEIKSFRGATTTRRLSVSVMNDVKKAASKQACSLFVTLFGAAQVLFGRLSDHDDVVIAAPMAGQSQAGEALLVGHCVNFLPLRIRFARERPFSDHMKAVKDFVLEASDRQNYTLGALVRDLDVKRDLNRLPLTDLQFNLEKIDAELDLPGVTTRFIPNPKAFTNFDLFLNIIESKEGLRLDCDFNTDVYDESTVQRWLGHYETLLGAIAIDASVPINKLPLLNDIETRYLRDELNATRRDFDLTQTTPSLIAAQARISPNAPAVSDSTQSLNYLALDSLSTRIASALVAQGINPGSRIAIAMDRTVSTVASMIATWKAGCAYVPLDMTTPAARVADILKGAEIAAVLADSYGLEHLPAGAHRVLELGQLLAMTDKASALPNISAHDSAYVIFTSGSTGQPKGVEISHRALSNFLRSMAELPGFATTDRIAAVTTFSFDISGLELFLPLIRGGVSIIASHEQVRSGFELVALVRDHGVSVLQATPSLWRILLDAGFTAPAGFRILCGGEPLPRDLANALLATGAEVWNLYGPTETTIWSAIARVAAEGSIVIGAPITNTSLDVLTEDLDLAPPGMTGDLWIGGEGLAKGYFKRPDLTEAAFKTISIAGAPPRRLYRTGDRARRLGDGNIQLLGRSDHQIKLRGFRIEIEEVEACLRQAPSVAAAAVALHQIGNDPRLVGYLVKKPDSDFSLNAISDHVSAHLPSYMVPATWVQLDALPQTGNGKLDRRGLLAPGPEEAIIGIKSEIKVPQTPTEAAIASIWEEVLGLKTIGTEQRFFSLGADSLQLFRIVARMNDKGFAVDARQLMKNVSIVELAASLESHKVQPVVSRPSIQKYKRRGRQEI